MFSGCKDPQVTERERKNRKMAREAAAEGIVLLKNDESLLPLEKGRKIALYGSGAGRTIKGGTGSGDVNERFSVTIWQGLKEKEFQITTESWLSDYDRQYDSARLMWKKSILDEVKGLDLDRFFSLYSSRPFQMPDGRIINNRDVELSDTDTAIYVLARRAGEAADRKAVKGDYYLTDIEMMNLNFLCGHYDHIILVINTGGIIDLSYLAEMPKIKSVIYMVQAGMEGGNALADIMSGERTPSGKLTDTWAENCGDYPFPIDGSPLHGNKDYYAEGIYVGYRYFEGFGVTPLFPFGFGLSYTQFSIKMNTGNIAVDAEKMNIKVQGQVTNSGKFYPGKETVQIYVSCPQGHIQKEKRKLCGFAKTKYLDPGESDKIVITFPWKYLASYSEQAGAWVIEKGVYGLWAGNSSDDQRLFAGIQVKEDNMIQKTGSICPLQETLKELVISSADAHTFEENWIKELAMRGLPIIELPKWRGKAWCPPYSQSLQEKNPIIEQLKDEDLVCMVVGESSKGQGSQNAFVGSAGTLIPGSAGETSSILYEKYGIPGVTMADGPAGLRLKKQYLVSKEGDMISDNPFSAFEGGFFAEESKEEGADTYYQYCTAFPVGTLLAQTWNTDLVNQVGLAVGKEMMELGISLWLAPGMNIHRNPLCGRNFEYFSEDPVLSGHIAAAIVKGVQTYGGLGCTVKHFACNNREEDRMESNSIISERTLREIYLKGFQIVVEEAQPLAIMTSYNLINGVHTANSFDLCTTAARNEWNFKGIIMTDWNTTSSLGGSTAWKCIDAGNDLIMPGCQEDIESIKSALESGDLPRIKLEKSAARIMNTFQATNKMTDLEHDLL